MHADIVLEVTICAAVAAAAVPECASARTTARIVLEIREILIQRPTPNRSDGAQKRRRRYREEQSAFVFRRSACRLRQRVFCLTSKGRHRHCCSSVLWFLQGINYGPLLPANLTADW